jgi:hypothetical protein
MLFYVEDGWMDELMDESKTWLKRLLSRVQKLSTKTPLFLSIINFKLFCFHVDFILSGCEKYVGLKFMKLAKTSVSLFD